MSMPYVQELLAGKVKVVGDANADYTKNQQWQSGMFKQRVSNKIWLTKTGLKGDQVADTKNHGGYEKAVFAYPISHYDTWVERLSTNTMSSGGMGENLAVNSMDEYSVCIGDIYQFHDAIIQVSQPRKPCWKPGRRFGIKDLPLQIQQTGLTGWYFRVLEEGFVQSNTELKLVKRPYPEWTIALCNDLMYTTKDIEQTKALYHCDLLATSWKNSLKKRLN